MGYSYSGYKGRSIGRLCYFMNQYCNLDIAEQAVFGDDDTVKYHGKVIATYKWSDKFGEKDVPEFEFEKPEFNRQQILKREEAISDAVKYDFHGEIQTISDDAAEMMRQFNQEAFRSAWLNMQIAGKKGWDFYFLVKNDKKILMFDGIKKYYWHTDMKEWLRAS